MAFSSSSTELRVVLIAETRENVTSLNVCARADLILDGTVKPGPEITLSDGSMAGVGNTIITRRHDRRLRNGHGWVRNGQAWTLSQVCGDGSVTIRPPGARFGNSIVLPVDDVAEHVDLGYVVTAHREHRVDERAFVLHYRVARATARPAGSGRTRKAPRLIAGRISVADSPMTVDMRHALDERRELIETRADAVLDTARAAGEAWTRPLGDQLRDPRKAAAWRRYARAIAACGDRYGITEVRPLGPVPDDATQKIDRARAEAALRQLASQPEPHSRHRPPAPTGHGPTR